MVGLVELRPQAETGVPRILRFWNLLGRFMYFDFFYSSYSTYFFNIYSEFNKNQIIFFKSVTKQFIP